ncbi:MAG: phosphatase PAP2 family protein [Candidatus Kapabacteria bacterium]|jgi:undecaprenyl-diphosphatase|nr:phosphatase PAP2 family protein [Candidatus Kapabacteria bacterium]
MPEVFHTIDVQLFTFLNSTISNDICDKIFPYITDVRNWLLVYVFLFGWLFWQGGKKGILTAVSLIAVILATDYLNSELLKDYFSRVRPCSALDDVRLLIKCGSGKSFPSSHAANMFAAATVLSYYYRKYRWIYFGIAVAIAFSRVYVGVHYPLDIAGGAIVGIVTGTVVVFIGRVFGKNIDEQDD